jgi:O-antigen ligase
MSTNVLNTSTIDTMPNRQRPAAALAQVSVIVLIFFSITAPVIYLSASLPWFKVEQLALPFILLVYGWFVLVGMARPVQTNAMFLIGGLFALCIGISVCYGSVLLGQTVILRDFYDIPKALLPVAFFTLALEADLSESSLRRLLDLFSLALLLVCLYAWAQWKDLGVSHFLAQFYSGGAHDEGSLAHYRRVYSTMGNPNFLGQLMTWAIVAFTLAALFKIGSRTRNLTMALACLVTLVMTGSRYGLLDTALGLVLILFLPSFFNRRRLVPLVILLVLLPVFGWVGFTVANRNRATFDRLLTLHDPLKTDSLRDRVDDLWQDALDEFLRSPFFGQGPAKTKFSDVFTDSEYLDVLKKFGIVGFFVYLGFFLFPLTILWKGLKKVARYGPQLEQLAPAKFWAMRLAFIMASTSLVMNVGMSTFYNAGIQAFLWMWLGIGVGALYSVDSLSRLPIASPSSFAN